MRHYQPSNDLAYLKIRNRSAFKALVDQAGAGVLEGSWGGLGAGPGLEGRLLGRVLLTSAVWVFAPRLGRQAGGRAGQQDGARGACPQVLLLATNTVCRGWAGIWT